MSRLSFRPRPLDIHKKLPIVKSIKDLDNDDSPGVSRTSQHGHNALDTEVLSTPTRRTGGSEIPTPQYVVVDSYEKDYTQTFNQPSSYLRGRGARNESTEYVEYDLDDEDEDWLQLLNNERKILSPERFESMLYRMEIMDHKSRERSGVPTVPGQPIPVALPKESAVEALRPHTSRQAVLAAVYDYWRAKRERWQKPILRRLQPPPPVNDTNPFNVFRPREKVHRPHTRRMQRRENDVQSFEKLRQVRRNLEHARDLLQLLQKREEKKRELVECEVMLQKGQIRSRHDARQDEDGIINNSMLPPLPQKLKHTDDYLFKSRTNNAAGALDQINGHSRMRTAFDVSPPATDGAVMAESMDQLRRKRKRRRLPQQRSRPAKSMAKMESLDPVLLFTQPLDPEKLAAAGIKPPLDPPVQNGSTRVPTCWHGRYGRGGRIIFDRWNFKNRTPLGSSPVPFSPNPVPSALERFHSPPPPRLGVEGAAEPPGMDTNAAAIPDTLQV